MSKKRIKELEDLIIHHKQKYYKGEAEISDAAYDEIEDELRELSPDSVALRMVGYEVSEEKMRHETPMLSLSKSRDPEDIIGWMAGQPCVVSDKMDGSSASIVYKAGTFLLAKTRGDGIYGENLTKYFRYITIPKSFQHAPLKDRDVELRGEVCISRTSFEHLGNEMENRGLGRPKSIRNIVAGLLHKKTDLDLCRYLDFIGYDLICNNADLATEIQKFETLVQETVVVPRYRLIHTADDLKAAIDHYNATIQSHDYPTDGLVIAVNDLNEQVGRGVTGHHPKGKMAFKFKSDTAVTRVRDILLDVGRTGKLTFVGLVEPVELSGATVRRVTLHNVKYIRDHRINKGSEIRITRSGEVIPKHEKTINTNGDYVFPTQCPLCRTDLRMSDTGVDLFCFNPDCKSRKYGQIAHWIRMVDIDQIGDSTLEKLFENGTVKGIEDLYTLTAEDISTLEKHGDKSAANIIQNIRSKKVLPIDAFLAGLGIDGLGKGVAKLILKAYPTLDAVKRLDRDALVNIKGVGEILAENIVAGLQTRGLELMEKLTRLGVTILDAESHGEEAGKIFADKTFVVTGALSRPRKEIERMIEEGGGKVAKAVSRNTTFLVCNRKSTSTKYTKAERLGVRIINEAALYELARERFNGNA